MCSEVSRFASEWVIEKCLYAAVIACRAEILNCFKGHDRRTDVNVRIKASSCLKTTFKFINPLFRIDSVIYRSVIRTDAALSYLRRHSSGVYPCILQMNLFLIPLK